MNECALDDVLRNSDRLAALRRLQEFAPAAEEAFTRLAGLAARLLRAPIALVTLVDDERQTVKSSFGLPEPWASARQTPLSHSLCQHLLVTGQPLVIGDARRDPLAHDNRLSSDSGWPPTSASRW